MLRREGLGGEDVERRAAEAATGQGAQEGPFVQNPAARHIDHEGPRGKAFEHSGSHRIHRFRGARNRDGQHVTLGSEPVERIEAPHPAHSGRATLLGPAPDSRHPHAERQGASSHGVPDAAEAEDTETQVLELRQNQGAVGEDVLIPP